MIKYVIYFQSKIESNNFGYFYRNRKEGFTSVFQPERAKKFKHEDNAFAQLKLLQEKEGEYYDFEIKEVYI